ncbi:efflux RND transporter permease subunit [Krasilnikoviella flava]|uniref:Putative drug exporter of the RND superfamily n=1 Tax=Krasilnikoviella flava TaxID=526729 RepID=A0A1T5LKP2_9MICO|nr:efflux RND transporter permease subunit [Krasilnikoviella flava]SKC76530.1 putative drug exporter of the RND superfamily [Krasilnikoviella flava]
MSSVLYSLGRWAARARRLVVIGWLLVLAVVGGAAGLLYQGFDNSVTIPGTESQDALDSLSATFPQVSGSSAQIIVVAPDGSTIEDDAVRGPVEDAVDDIGELDQVAAVTSPYDDQMAASVNDDDTATLLTIQLDGDQSVITEDTKDALHTASDDLAAALPAGSQASLGGELFSVEFPALSIIEAIGVVVALVVLIITLGSFVAAGLPLINALMGVGVSMLLLLAATVFGPINSTTPMLGLMLGLAVGIDYALFIVSRHREQLAAGLEVDESIARAVATAGSAVIFAGLTVMIALVGLGVAGIPFLTVMGIAAAVAVGIAVLISLTLLPALLSFSGERLRPRAPRAARKPKGKARRAAARAAAGPADGAHHNRFFDGWVRGATRFPVLTIVLIVGAIAALAWPATNLRLALPDAGTLPEDNSARVTYDLVGEEFGEGFNGPLIVTGSIVTSNDPVKLMDELGDEIGDLPGVADVPLSTPNPSADTGIIQVVPEGGPTSQETKDLVNEIRDQHDHYLDTYGVDLSVTGFAAVGIDVSDKLGAALLPFALVVVGLSLVLLTMVFRSIWVPVKASLGYLLSVGAAFGVVTLVFENGVLADALNVTKLGPVISFMPIILMGVLFGLAMDYEVFLVSRIREDYVHGGDARRAVRTGFLGSAKVVTAAAVIMFAVFVAFVPEGDMTLKPIALGLAVGVLVDAFVVRMTLVPAVLALLGERAWHMPRWLDRILPTFDVEGEGLTKELRLASWPEPDAKDAVAARDLEVAGPEGSDVPVVGPVSVRVPEGGALCVHGDAAAPVSALLLALAGRMAPDAGAVKVTGLVLPERAMTVRGRVAVVDALAEHGRPAAVVDAAVRDGAQVVVVDRTDAVADRPAREALAAALARAQRGGTAVLLGASGVAATDLLDDGTGREVAVLDVGAGWGAPSALTGAEVPPPAPPVANQAPVVEPVETQDAVSTSSTGGSNDEDTQMQEVRA